MGGGLGVAIVVVGVLAVNSIYSSASAKAPTRTATVQQGTVAATVTATGNVAPASNLSVNFQSGGTVTEIDVKPGDQVKAGQTLAKIDDTQTAAALASAQAGLASAQANLTNVSQPLTAAVAAQNAAALLTGQQQVATAQASVTAAAQGAALNATGYQNLINQAIGQLNRDTNQLSSDQANCATGTTTGSGSGGGQSCAAQSVSDQNAIAKDRDALTNANQQQATGQLKDQQAIQQAQNSLNSAQAALASTQASNNAKATATPASVAAAQSQVAQAQANLVAAQKAEANATLTAPSDAAVATVSGIVGQTVSGGGTSAASSSSSSSAASSSSSGSSSAFITLEDTASLQVVSGFAESDASKVQVGQSATVSLNALPNQAVTAKVSRVDVNATVVSNVVTYNVTVVLDNPPATVKPGMTASVDVVVNQHDNVLALPTADITSRGGTSTVTLLRSGKQISQVVETGLVGDQTTEITSGVSEGDVVVAPTVSITATGTGTGRTGTGTGTGAGAGGLGGAGGGFFGGGGGAGAGAGAGGRG